jgi:thiol peroxidase
MAETSLRGNPINTVGDLPEVGSTAPAFELTKSDLSPVSSADFAGQNIVLNIFPSVDTATCAASVRTFNERAASMENTTVVCVSADLPFALGRFCGAEGIEDVVTTSTFRSPAFGTDYGTLMVDGPLHGVHARAVVVIAPDGTVAHTQIVPEVPDEPDYDAAIAALS